MSSSSSSPAPSTAASASSSTGAPGATSAPPAGAAKQSKRFCEQDYAANGISCPSGNLKINKFQYWRSGGSCVYPQDPSRQFPDCAGQDYAQKMQGFVQGNSLSFSRPINDMLGADPCPNIYKQIDVDYTCGN